MKELKSNGFGFSAVNAGQRAVNYEPQIIAVSTEGGFRLTPPVTKALGIAAGDNVMFVNNISKVDEAIVDRNEAIVAFCEENGLDIESPEARVAIHKEFDQWAICKGVQEYDSKGLPKTCVERLSQKDKVRFATVNYEKMLEAALAEEDGAEQDVKDALTRDGITREEQCQILSNFVVAKELPKYMGSKSNNPAGLSGIGTSLNFTDSNVWKQLKAGMGEEATKINRVFSLDLDKIVTESIFNGYENVEVKLLILGDSVDKEPARIGGDKNED